jgi:hypothetical protein
MADKLTEKGKAGYYDYILHVLEEEIFTLGSSKGSTIENKRREARGGLSLAKKIASAAFDDRLEQMAEDA